MANCAKWTRNAMPNIFAHCDRTQKNNHNDKIDPARSCLNYNLAPNPQGNQNEILKNRLEQVKVLKRKDVNVVCSWVVTLPKDFKGNQKEFFKATYRFLEEKYKQENVISAYVHLDETTPHMHFLFVPVVLDKKKGIEKVSAKEVLTRTELQKFHPQLKKYLEKELKQPVSILNGATANGNATIKQLKAETALQEAQIFEKEKSAAAVFLKSLDTKAPAIPEKISGIPNIGSPEKWEKNFPLQKKGALSKESAYEYCHRQTTSLWDHFKKHFYDPLKNKFDKLIDIIRILKLDNEQKNDRISTLEAQNKTLTQEVDKIIDQRLKDRTETILKQGRQEYQQIYKAMYTDKFTFQSHNGIKCTAKKGLLNYAQTVTDELVEFRNMTPKQFKNWYDKQQGQDRSW